MFIKEARARVIKNSRSEKTIEILIKTFNGKFISSAPSGKSKGKYEVPDFNPRGISWSLKLTREFLLSFEGKAISIKKFQDLEKIEDEIQKFEKGFGKLGGNVVYAIESAFLKASAEENKKQLWKFIFDSFYHGKKKIPMPIGNTIGGGLHSKKLKGKKPDFQEFLIIPDEKTFSRAVTKMVYAYDYAKILLKKHQKKWISLIRRNDENAWTTSLTNETILEIMTKLKNKYNLRIGVDVASSGFFEKSYYNYENKRLIRDRIEQIDYMEYLIKKFGIFYIEDPLDEEDFLGFKQLKNSVSKNVLIVGDDLTVTNLERVKKAVNEKNSAINAIIVKPNQVGSLIETAKVVEFCKKKNLKIIFSHRSGETLDDVLADFAVGFQADFIKCGIFGKERLVKLRRILEIEKELKL